jgi:type II secretory pathway component PulF
VVICVASTLFALVITRVLPQFEWLNAAHFGPLTPLAKYPHAVEIASVVVPCLAVFAVAFWWWQSGRLSGALRSGVRIFDWLPGLQRVRYWSEAATFAELMLLLVRNQVPLHQSLRLMSEATNERQLKRAAVEVAERIERGEAAWATTANVARQHRTEFPLLIRLALYHAENRSLLAGALQQAATLYRERAIRSAEWYAEYVPILLTIGIGGTLTICFTLSVLWPYASALHEMAGNEWR